MPNSHITFGVDLLPKDQTNAQNPTQYYLGNSTQRWSVYINE